jgi:hypothetical protein
VLQPMEYCSRIDLIKKILANRRPIIL